MHRRVLVILGVLLLFGGIAAACTSNTDDPAEGILASEQHLTDLGEEVAALREQVIRGNMIATLNLLQDVGFHEINMEVREAGEAPAGTSGKIRTAFRAVAATTWPDDLSPAAADFQAKLQAFFDVLRGEDTSAQGESSQIAHDSFHAFAGDAWNFLAESVGLTEPPRQEGEDAGS